MICVDTSVVVAGLCPWHEFHGLALPVMRAHPHAPTHALLESYSTMTRLPAPFRMPSDVAAALLAEQFSGRSLHPSAEAVIALPARLAAQGLFGGAVYDALVAVTVAEAGGDLISFDDRAQRTYAALGVSVSRPGGGRP